MKNNSEMDTNALLKKEPTEALIIDRILNGEIELFEILIRRYNELLYRTIRSYLFVENDIEDTMQDTYIKAFEKLYQFKNKSMFSTWLVRIGINEALQRKRKSPKYDTVALQQDDFNSQIADQVTMNPERNVIYKESSKFMEKAIDTLPEKYKIVYMLREVEGLDISEICNCLDLSNSNVKVRLHRARTMLRNSILEQTDYSSIFEFGNSRCDNIVSKVMEHIYKKHSKI